MPDDLTMTNQELAKQLTTYADAITSFAWIQAIGFCFVMAKPKEVLDSILTGAGVILTSLGIVVGTVIYYRLTLHCMNWVEKLEKGETRSAVDGTPRVPSSAKNSTDERNEVLQSIRKTRLILIVLSGVLPLLALILTKVGTCCYPKA